ncbi:hypothetical protein CDV36_015421 [Fusarium kuroshium]|uniref:Uncharacterized protein n=1 Tax=Fusarium kuroshium TaxID=2010991 RepID=A0A3M2RAI1_9HYPO|nr:hypothetical protein CDV36_015421 [Fusarium kuroshium]
MWADGGAGVRPDMAGTDVARLGTVAALGGTVAVAVAVLRIHPAPNPPPSMSNHRVEKALLESGVAEEMEDDEDDEKGLVPEESDLDTSFAKDSREVLAYLGVDHENANSWSEILLTLCVGLPMWEYLDSRWHAEPRHFHQQYGEP